MPHAYLYVDGESHYIRSRDCAKSLFGASAELSGLRAHRFSHPAPYLDAKSRFFWSPAIEQVPNPRIVRAVYFTAMTGDADESHRVKAMIRQHGFEPHVVTEAKNLCKTRENLLVQSGVIEKAKGVDISMAVRVLEDAQRDNFHTCVLVTSDVDYLPVIEAVRRMGKFVEVWGYRSGLSGQSPFDHVPDKFMDLTEIIQREFNYDNGA